MAKMMIGNDEDAKKWNNEKVYLKTKISCELFPILYFYSATDSAKARDMTEKLAETLVSKAESWVIDQLREFDTMEPGK